jgi:hypothetical protein
MAEYALRLANAQDTAARVRKGDGLGLQHAGNTNTRSGLRPDGGGVVSVVAGTMGVQVTPFRAWVDGGTSDAQGGYPFILDATKTLTLSDGHATLSRTDTIAVVVHEDAFDGSGLTDATVVVVAGTPGSGAPALPATAVPLRDVIVPAGLSTGTGGLASGNLSTDRRAYLAGTGGVVTVTGATQRAALGALAGQTVYRQDTGLYEFYDGTTWDTYMKVVTPAYLHMYHAAGTTRAVSADTAVTMDTIGNASGGAVGGATFTLGPAGLYSVSFAAKANGASGGGVSMRLEKNGSAWVEAWASMGNTAPTTVGASKIIRVAAGDTFQLFLTNGSSQSGAVTYAGGQARLFFTSLRVGD